MLFPQDGVQLSESSHYTFVYDDPEYSLVILNTCPDHSGVYTCTAKNLAGANSCKAELTVHTGSEHRTTFSSTKTAIRQLKVDSWSLFAEPKEVAEPLEDEGSILRKMRRLTDYYDTHKEIGR